MDREKLARVVRTVDVEGEVHNEIEFIGVEESISVTETVDRINAAAFAWLDREIKRERLEWIEAATLEERERCAKILCSYCRDGKTAYYMKNIGWVHGPGEGIGWTRACDAEAIRSAPGKDK